jgi:hypothetical protein
MPCKIIISAFDENEILTRNGGAKLSEGLFTAYFEFQTKKCRMLVETSGFKFEKETKKPQYNEY